MRSTESQEEKVRGMVLNAIHEVAPEVDLQAIRFDQPVRDQIDLDSMDFLNILIKVHRALGVNVPEADYAKLATINGFVAYLMARLGSRRP